MSDPYARLSSTTTKGKLMKHIHFVTAGSMTIDPRDPDTIYGVCADWHCNEPVYAFFIESDGDRLGSFSSWREIGSDLSV